MSDGLRFYPFFLSRRDEIIAVNEFFYVNYSRKQWFITFI